MRAIGSLSIALCAMLASAHPQLHEEGPSKCDCASKPAFQSYHIHALFFADGASASFNPHSIAGAMHLHRRRRTLTASASANPHSKAGAMQLRAKFMKHFDVPHCNNKTGLFNQSEMCAFEVGNRPGFGNALPFVVPNFAIYLPVHRYAEAVPWMMQNRGEYDVLVHPNSCSFSCAAEDHLKWSMWAGNKWELRFPGAADPLVVV